MQFFLGLKEFDPNPVFDPSLFVEIIKRVGHEAFDSLSTELIKSVSQEKDQRHNKKKKKSNATHRKMTRKLLEGVSRDIKHINNMLDEFKKDGRPFPLKPARQRMFWIINNVYHQQKQMYDTRTHSCPNRIVSILDKKFCY